MTAITATMHDRLIPILSIAAGALFAVYVTLVMTTIFFAAWQTQLASGIRDTQSDISLLESKYYSTMDELAATNPGSVGLVAPAHVEYVAAAKLPNLTFAGR